MSDAFRLLVKRMDRSLAKRRPTNPRPLIYVANVAQSKGGRAFHVHVLLWEYIHSPVLIGHCKALGLGQPKLRQLPSDPTGDANYWQQVVYIVGQQEPVFGSDEFKRHEERPKFARRLLYPAPSTLKQHAPDLLSALQAAKDPSVPDEELLLRLPKFSS
jgi:hypothetical protein